MSRIVAVALCCVASFGGLCGCSSPGSSSMPDLSGFGLGSVFGPHKVMLAVASDPPGANAMVSPTNSCRTPCSLAFETAGEFPVEVSRDGYVPQSVPVKVSAPENTGFALAAADRTLKLDPAALSVKLEVLQPSTGKGPRSNAQRGQRGHE